MTNKDLELYANEWLNTVTHEDLMDNPFPLIIDREQADVDRVMALNGKTWKGMTAEERKEWNGVMKGAYNADDMNRVGMAVEHITDLFRSYGYTVSTSPKTDWAVGDIPRLAEWRTYLENVRTLRSMLPVLPDTQPIPGNLVRMKIVNANNIEKNLIEIEMLLENMAAAWFYSGDLYAGEV